MSDWREEKELSQRLFELLKVKEDTHFPSQMSPHTLSNLPDVFYLSQKEIDTGFDVHSYTAKVISDAGQHTTRQEAKAHTFAPLFGASGYGRTKAEATYYKHFNDKYRGIANWHKNLADEALRFLKITNISGRQYAFPDVTRRHSGVPTHFTMIKNYPVQGFATGDVVPLVLIELDARLEKMQSGIVNSVHDSIVIDVHPDEIDFVLATIKQVNGDMKAVINTHFDICEVITQFITNEISSCSI